MSHSHTHGHITHIYSRMHGAVRSIAGTWVTLNILRTILFGLRRSEAFIHIWIIYLCHIYVLLKLCLQPALKKKCSCCQGDISGQVTACHVTAEPMLQPPNYVIATSLTYCTYNFRNNIQSIGFIYMNCQQSAC